MGCLPLCPHSTQTATIGAPRLSSPLPAQEFFRGDSFGPPPPGREGAGGGGPPAPIGGTGQSDPAARRFSRAARTMASRGDGSTSCPRPGADGPKVGPSRRSRRVSTCAVMAIGGAPRAGHDASRRLHIPGHRRRHSRQPRTCRRTRVMDVLGQAAQPIQIQLVDAAAAADQHHGRRADDPLSSFRKGGTLCAPALAHCSGSAGPSPGLGRRALVRSCRTLAQQQDQRHRQRWRSTPGLDPRSVAQVALAREASTLATRW